MWQMHRNIFTSCAASGTKLPAARLAVSQDAATTHLPQRTPSRYFSVRLPQSMAAMRCALQRYEYLLSRVYQTPLPITAACFTCCGADRLSSAPGESIITDPADDVRDILRKVFNLS